MKGFFLRTAFHSTGTCYISFQEREAINGSPQLQVNLESYPKRRPKKPNSKQLGTITLKVSGGTPMLVVTNSSLDRRENNVWY